jgi:glycine cleavage system aminomethyltransferase T
MSKDPDAAARLVSELYDSTEIRNDYILFRLGNDRLLLMPNNVQTQQI